MRQAKLLGFSRGSVYYLLRPVPDSYLSHVFADGGYASEKLQTALQEIDDPTIEIIKHPNGANGFVII